jgi:hypothetical protein
MLELNFLLPTCNCKLCAYLTSFHVKAMLNGGGVGLLSVVNRKQGCYLSFC